MNGTRRRSSRLAFVSVVLAVLALALPTAADAYIYWLGPGGIGRANLDGRGVRAKFIAHSFASEPEGLAVGGPFIYFGAANDLIGRARMNGGEVAPEFVKIRLPGQQLPSYIDEARASVTVGGHDIYWAGAHERIGHASLSGSDVQPDFLNAEGTVSAVAADAHYVYWTSEHAIGRVRLDGSEPDPRFIPLRRSPAPGLAVADNHIYWGTELIGRSISRANVDGSGLDQNFITGLRLNTMSGIAVAGGYIYWQAGSQRRSGQWIGRARVDGTEVRRKLVDVSALAGNGLFSGGLAADPLGPHPRRTTQPRQPGKK